jgi:hypothetical protein
VVDAARHGAEPPPALVLAFWCGDEHLPDVGGMFDQDYATYSKMITARNIYDAVRTSQRATGKTIHDLPAGVKRTMHNLKRQGYL